jgi:hypothetical protein
MVGSQQLAMSRLKKLETKLKKENHFRLLSIEFLLFIILTAVDT